MVTTKGLYTQKKIILNILYSYIYCELKVIAVHNFNILLYDHLHVSSLFMPAAVIRKVNEWWIWMIFAKKRFYRTTTYINNVRIARWHIVRRQLNVILYFITSTVCCPSYMYMRLDCVHIIAKIMWQTMQHTTSNWCITVYLLNSLMKHIFVCMELYLPALKTCQRACCYHYHYNNMI